MRKSSKSEAVVAVKKLHEAVDGKAERLLEVHSDRLQCRRGCYHCCADGITVFEIEADVIRIDYAALLAHDQPGAHGMCAFLDERGACRIYNRRPYVCRTQGLPLRWIEADDEDVVEYRDICPLNETEEHLEELPISDFWTLGHFEGQLATLQSQNHPEMKRVPLRRLFVRDTNLKIEPNPPKIDTWSV